MCYYFGKKLFWKIRFQQIHFQTIWFRQIHFWQYIFWMSLHHTNVTILKDFSLRWKIIWADLNGGMIGDDTRWFEWWCQFDNVWNPRFFSPTDPTDHDRIGLPFKGRVSLNLFYSFISPVGHKKWWENSRNGSFGPKTTCFDYFPILFYAQRDLWKNKTNLR